MASSLGGMNYIVMEIEFDEKHPYTVELRGELRQSRMLSFLKGYNLEIEFPTILSDKQNNFVEKELLKYFSGNITNKTEIEKIRDELPIIIHIPPEMK